MAKPLPVGATLLMLAALAFADGARAAAPAQYEHDAAGRRTALKLPNGVNTTYAHDAAGRLTRIESKNAAGNVISAFGYTLDATGNRIAMDVTLNGVHNRIEYAFDNAYRLTRETRKDAAGQTLYAAGLTYDPVGNRLTQARTQIAAVNGAPQTVTENTVYAYNNANQLLTETTNGVTTAYGYDKNGNNTTIATPAANGNPAKNIAMTYDWLNRQTRWTDGTRTESTVFAGADWKRASTTVSGAGVAAQTTKYLYDGDNVLADYDANNALTAFYVTPGLDQNLSIADASGQTAYYTHDGLGSVRTLTAANSAILNRYDYTAFGETFAPNTVTTTSNRYTYTAREQSPLAAHGAPMYYRWRNYPPSVGRFMWRDPIGYKGGINLYVYGENRSNVYVDYYGLNSHRWNLNSLARKVMTLYGIRSNIAAGLTVNKRFNHVRLEDELGEFAEDFASQLQKFYKELAHRKFLARRITNSEKEFFFLGAVPNPNSWFWNFHYPIIDTGYWFASLQDIEYRGTFNAKCKCGETPGWVTIEITNINFEFLVKDEIDANSLEESKGKKNASKYIEAFVDLVNENALINANYFVTVHTVFKKDYSVLVVEGRCDEDN